MTVTTTSTEDGALLPARYTPRALATRLEPVPGGPTLTGAARSNSALRAALWILSGLRRDDARVWSHVAVDGWIDFAAILNEPGWTRAERAAVRAAWSLRYINGTEVRLDELAAWLDQELWHAVLEALRIRRDALDGGER